MTKITITLTLTDEDAETLIETLKIGADHRFSPNLARDSRTIADYVERRKDAALFARGRARRREEARKASDAYIAAVGRASAVAAKADRELSDEDYDALRVAYGVKRLV